MRAHLPFRSEEYLFALMLFFLTTSFDILKRTLTIWFEDKNCRVLETITCYAWVMWLWPRFGLLSADSLVSLSTLEHCTKFFLLFCHRLGFWLSLCEGENFHGLWLGGPIKSLHVLYWWYYNLHTPNSNKHVNTLPVLAAVDKASQNCR